MSETQEIVIPGFRRVKAANLELGCKIAIWGPEGSTQTAVVTHVERGPQTSAVVAVRDDTREPVASVFANAFLLQVKE